jgi:hypothetical protein
MDVNIANKEGKIKSILWIALGNILQIPKFTQSCDIVLWYHKKIKCLISEGHCSYGSCVVINKFVANLKIKEPSNTNTV